MLKAICGSAAANVSPERIGYFLRRERRIKTLPPIKAKAFMPDAGLISGTPTGAGSAMDTPTKRRPKAISFCMFTFLVRLADGKPRERSASTLLGRAASLSFQKNTSQEDFGTGTDPITTGYAVNQAQPSSDSTVAILANAVSKKSIAKGSAVA